MAETQFDQTQGVPDAMTQAEDTDRTGQYALDLLQGEERSLFEMQLAQDSDLRQEVSSWQEHFAALGMEIDEIAPPASVFAHLRREYLALASSYPNLGICNCWHCGCVG